MQTKESYKRFYQILPSVFELLDNNSEDLYFSEDMEHRMSFLRYIMEEPFENLWDNLWYPMSPPDDHSIFSKPIFFHEFTHLNDILSYIFHGKSKTEMQLEKNQIIWYEIQDKLNHGMV